MSRFGSEIAETGETVLEERRLASRIAASVVVAIVAYLGLLFGGNIVIGPSSAPNSLSSSSRDSQQTQVTARDAIRGLLISDRKVAPKQQLHDAGPALWNAAPALQFANWRHAAPAPEFGAPLRPVAAQAHQPRAPPQVT
ncbi:hypothetical protein [Rhizobium sp. WYJ-E13]|uniref:hypothetical protein n=1 Tax=unclassified Rhizobium TaxID=2613769 RepID=UPI001C1EC29B|nr:hypothetical protein [Rhizobium sp. WYJ-E13]QWW68352.1 hypothetical protein KQ933_01190 [Rhizobium sp. WYJ-E13]